MMWPSGVVVCCAGMVWRAATRARRLRGLSRFCSFHIPYYRACMRGHTSGDPRRYVRTNCGAALIPLARYFESGNVSANKKAEMQNAPRLKFYRLYGGFGNIYLVPGERIELPTYRLQGDCTTAVLTRQIGGHG